MLAAAADRAGAPGADGAPGQPFANAVVDAVNTLNPGDPATVVVIFDGTLVHFTFSIPQGAPGEITTAQLDTAIATTAQNPATFPPFTGTFSDPVTQAEMPSRQTDIAYARKIGVIMGIIGFDEHDSWELIRDGREQLDAILAAGRRGEVAGRECFLWTCDFRRVFDPAYEPSAADKPRPPRLPHCGISRDYVAFAREIVADGRAAQLAQRLSVDLGFRVHADVRSLAFALQRQLIQRVSEEL